MRKTAVKSDRYGMMLFRPSFEPVRSPAIRKGPRWSEVRGVDVQESALENRRGFHIRH